MIVFVTTAAHDYTIRSLMEAVCTPLNGRLIALSWGEFLSWKRLPVGDYVLADVDRLSGTERDRAVDRLAALRRALPGCRVLNHPRNSLRRPELLATLSDAGINDFSAYGAEVDPSLPKYPVFVRSTIEHDRPLTSLLNNAAELTQALQAFRSERRDALRDLLVVEFVDVRNAQGLFEKYSAFRIGETIFASDYSAGESWVCKGDEDDEHAGIDPVWVTRDLDYQRRNPHEPLLRPIFELARIDYGRIDYAFHRGRLQVFEINTNPMRGLASASAPDWQASVQRSDTAWFGAMAALQTRASSGYYRTVEAADPIDRVDGGTLPRRCLRRLLRIARLLHREHDLFRLRNKFRLRRPPD